MLHNKNEVVSWMNIKHGDSNQITREYFEKILLEMRLIDSTIPSTSFTLFGRTFATPVMTAALSHLNNTHAEGMVELARGAMAADAVMWAGMGDKKELENILSTGASTIKIVKPYEDNRVIIDRLHHAEEFGAFAVGMDIDHAFNCQGGYDIVFDQPMRPKSSDEIKSFVKATKLPFIVKGVLSVQDAIKCLNAEVSGIVVSHHHGIMNYALPPLMILPEILKAINGSIPVFVDCNIESGMDVFKALALGASACSIGRGLMEPLKKDGAAGVSQAICQITHELAHAMAMTCSPDINSIDRSVLRFI